MEREAVPLAGLTENFSSIPLMAPPPVGREMEGISIALDLVFPPSVLKSGVEGLADSVSRFMLIPNRCPGVRVSLPLHNEKIPIRQATKLGEIYRKILERREPLGKAARGRPAMIFAADHTYRPGCNEGKL